MNDYSWYKDNLPIMNNYSWYKDNLPIMNNYSWYKDNLPIMNDKIAPGFAELHDLHLLESLYNLPGKPS